jgi:hypothetical protein
MQEPTPKTDLVAVRELQGRLRGVLRAEDAALRVEAVVGDFLREYKAKQDASSVALYALAATGAMFEGALNLVLGVAENPPDALYSPTNTLIDSALIIIAANVTDSGMFMVPPVPRARIAHAPPASVFVPFKERPQPPRRPQPTPAPIPQPKAGDLYYATLQHLWARRCFNMAVPMQLLKAVNPQGLAALQWLLQVSYNDLPLRYLWLAATATRPPRDAVVAVKILNMFKSWLPKPAGLVPGSYAFVVRNFKRWYIKKEWEPFLDHDWDGWVGRLDPEWVHVLVVNNLSLDPFDGGEYIRRWPAENKILHLLAILRETPPRVLGAKDHFGWSMLSTAVAVGCVPAVETLVSRGVDAQAATNAAGTPAMVTALSLPLEVPDSKAEAIVNTFLEKFGRAVVPSEADIAEYLARDPFLTPRIVWRRFHTLLAEEDAMAPDDAAHRYRYQGPSREEVLRAWDAEGWVADG